MHFQIVSQEQFLNVNLSGKMYSQDIPILHEKITNCIATGSPYIILDVSKVTYMDKASLNLLVSLYKETGSSHGYLIIKGSNGIVGNLIKTTHLAELTGDDTSNTNVEFYRWSSAKRKNVKSYSEAIKNRCKNIIKRKNSVSNSEAAEPSNAQRNASIYWHYQG